MYFMDTYGCSGCLYYVNAVVTCSIGWLLLAATFDYRLVLWFWFNLVFVSVGLLLWVVRC